MKVFCKTDFILPQFCVNLVIFLLDLKEGYSHLIHVIGAGLI